MKVIIPVKIKFELVGKIITYALPVAAISGLILVLLMRSFSLLLLGLYLVIPILISMILYFFYGKDNGKESLSSKD